MQDSPDNPVPEARPEPETVRRLLAALGEWGVAEVEGASQPMLEQLADQALDAYQDAVAVA